MHLISVFYVADEHSFRSKATHPSASAHANSSEHRQFIGMWSQWLPKVDVVFHYKVLRWVVFPVQFAQIVAPASRQEAISSAICLRHQPPDKKPTTKVVNVWMTSSLTREGECASRLCSCRKEATSFLPPLTNPQYIMPRYSKVLLS